MDRDRAIIAHLTRFPMATSRQLQRLFFAANASSTPSHRVLARLVRDGYLVTVDRRLIGGAKGGAGMNVFTLGREGHRLARRGGTFRRKNAIDLHALAIGDVYVNLKELERAGAIELLDFESEPDSWRVVQGVNLEPDLFVDFARRSDGARLVAWLEVDMGTQHPARLNEKMDRYSQAARLANLADLPTFPVVVFTALDDERCDAIRRVIDRRGDDARLFRVATVCKFPADMR